MDEESLLPAEDGLVITTAAQMADPQEGEESEEVTANAGTETDAELAPADDDEDHHGDIDKAQKAINKKTWQMHDERRKREAAEARIQELEAKIAVVKPVSVVPPLPDPYAMSDDEYDRKMAERDAALERQAEERAEQRYAANQSRQQQEESNRLQQQEIVSIREKYAERSISLGYDADEVLKATADVVSFGVSDPVAEMIATDAQGPALAMWLRDNPRELKKLQTMPIYEQIETLRNVRKGETRKTQSNAPKPPTDIRSGGAVSIREDVLAGATFTTSR